MVVLRSTSGLHMGEFDGAEAIAALGFDRRSQQKAVFGDVNAHIRQFLGSGFLKNSSSKFRQTAVSSAMPGGSRVFLNQSLGKFREVGG